MDKFFTEKQWPLYDNSRLRLGISVKEEYGNFYRYYNRKKMDTSFSALVVLAVVGDFRTLYSSFA